MRANISQGTTQSILPVILPVAMLLFMLAGMGPNSLLAMGSLVALVIGANLLWRPGESPIFLFIFALQWLQASTSIFQANTAGVPANDVSMFGADMERATILSLLGILVAAVGMRLGAGAQRPADAQIARFSAMRLTPMRAGKLYLLAWIAASGALSCAYVIPGLSQVFLAFASLKWAFFFILTYVTFSRPGASKLYWLIAFLVEFGMGIGGFFSDFKTVFFFTGFGMLAAGVRMSAGRVMGLGMLGMAAIASMIVWTSIKVEYRSFVSKGATAQSVKVDYSTSMDKIGELLSNLDGDKLGKGVNDFLSRAAYVEMFGLVLNYVPQVLPYEKGALWADAISRPFMPRLFFPWKTAIDDSERTVKYTGMNLAGSEQGTSISIGYVGEAYIDFGPYVMMAVLFAYGVLLGRMYRWLLDHRNSRGLLGMALASAIMAGAGTLEASVTKVFGGLIVGLLVSVLIIYFLVPRYPNWLRF